MLKVLIPVHLDGIRSVYCVFLLVVNDAVVFNWIIVMRVGDVLVYIIAYDAPKLDVSRETMRCWVARAAIVLFFLIVFSFEMVFAFILLILFFDAVLLLLFHILRGFAPVFLLFLFFDLDGGTFLLIKMAYHLLVRICLFCFT